MHAHMFLLNREESLIYKEEQDTIFPLPAPLSFLSDTALFDFTSGFAIPRPTRLVSSFVEAIPPVVTPLP